MGRRIEDFRENEMTMRLTAGGFVDTRTARRDRTHGVCARRINFVRLFSAGLVSGGIRHGIRDRPAGFIIFNKTRARIMTRRVLSVCSIK